jgi:hypothetical protein
VCFKTDFSHVRMASSVITVAMLRNRSSRIQFPDGGNKFFYFSKLSDGLWGAPRHSHEFQGLFLGLNWSTREVEYSRSSDTEVRKQWSFTSTRTHTPLWRAQG